MKLSQKEVAELKREQTELEKKRADLKEKCKNHRGMTIEDLNGITENLRSVSLRLDEIGNELKDAEVPEKRDVFTMIKDYNGKEITSENYRASSKYRDAFFRSYLNNKISESDADIMSMGKRTSNMNGDSVTSGGEYLVPQTTLNNVYTVIKQYGKLYSSITKYGFTGDVALPIGNAGDVTQNSDGTITLNYTYTEAKISQDAIVASMTIKNILLKNSIPAFEQFLSNEIGKYIGMQLENNVLNGASDSNFLGIVTALKASAGVEDPSAAKTYSTLDWKAIAAIMGTLESPYGDNATWIMKRSTFFNKFFSLTDSTGKPIVSTVPLITGLPKDNNYSAASPFMIAGQPVIFSSLVPDEDGILYGDLSQYIVNESQSFIIESNASEKFSSDKTVWRGKIYSGGTILFPKKTFTYTSYVAS